MGAGVSPNKITCEPYTFQVTVGTTSTAVTSRDLRKYNPVSIEFMGHPDNTGVVYVGNKILGIDIGGAKRKVTTVSGRPLVAGASASYETNDPRRWSAIASAAGQTLCVTVGLTEFPGSEATTS